MAHIIVISDKTWTRLLDYTRQYAGGGGWQGLLHLMRAGDTEPEDVMAKAKEIGVVDARKQLGLTFIDGAKEGDGHEYYCCKCFSFRLSMCDETPKCANCGSKKIIIGAPGELDRATLDKEHNHGN